jgi:hypothetical protein
MLSIEDGRDTHLSAESCKSKRREILSVFNGLKSGWPAHGNLHVCTKPKGVLKGRRTKG